MMLAFPAALALAHRCAPGIAPEAILSIVSVESAFDPLAIHVNHVGRFRAGSAAEATAVASRWIAAGYSVDLGLAQINSRNLAWTGLTVASAFDPCSSLAAAEKVLTFSYARATREAQGLEAISRTFSLYNSGNTSTGFRNSYVSRVWRAAEQIVPQIGGSPVPGAIALDPAPQALAAASAPPPSFVIGPTDRSALIFK